MRSDRMTIRDIAGFCPEEAVWKMIADVSELLLKEGYGNMLTPDSIVVEGYAFMVETGGEGISPSTEFLAPEHESGVKSDEIQMVWSLGALAYYTATGHIIFGGHGGRYQKAHPSVALPVLPKGLQALTPVLQKCLCFAPDERIKLNDLRELAQQGLKACEKRQRRQSVSATNESNKEVKPIGEKWPEEMIEV